MSNSFLKRPGISTLGQCRQSSFPIRTLSGQVGIGVRKTKSRALEKFGDSVFSCLAREVS